MSTTNGFDLSEKAMLAELNIGTWLGRKRDKKVTGEVIDENKSEKDAGAWWTRVVPPKALAGIQSAVSAGRDQHYKLTMPWSDSGPRILPASMFFDYADSIRTHKEKFTEAVSDFLVEYPKLVLQAQSRLGDLFRPEFFPKVDVLESKFYWNFRITPIPNAADFRVSVGKEEAEEIRKSIERDSKKAFSDAMGDLWTRLHDGVSKLAEKLKDEKAIFRNSLVGNVVEICDLLPKLNITGDADLNRLRQEVVDKLTKTEVDTLRENKHVRADTAAAATDILDRMKAFLPKSE